jgi:hypothetical protein
MALVKKLYSVTVTDKDNTISGGIRLDVVDGVLMDATYSDHLAAYDSEIVDAWLCEGNAIEGDSITLHTHEDGELSNHKFDGESYVNECVMTVSRLFNM